MKSLRGVAVALLALGAACSQSEQPPPVVQYDPYAGVAFPSTRAKIPRSKGDLGLTVDIGSDTITVIDSRAVLPTGSSDPVTISTCIAPHDLALSSPDGRKAYVACYGEDAIAVVDTTNASAPVLRVTVSGSAGTPGAPTYGPYSIEMSPTERLLYVGMSESKEVRFFDTATNTFTSVVAPLKGVPGIGTWSDDEGTLYVAVQSPDALAAIDTKTGDIKQYRAFDGGACLNTRGAIPPSDPTLLYVICEGNHTDPGWILVVDRATFATKAKHVVGVYPNELEILGAP